MSLLLNLATAAYTLTALVLLALSAAGWWRSRRPKTGILTLAFAWFAIAGLLASWWLFSRQDVIPLLTLHILLTGIGLLTIYFATVKR